MTTRSTTASRLQRSTDGKATVTSRPPEGGSAGVTVIYPPGGAFAPTSSKEVFVDINGAAAFRRGDANVSGGVDVADAIFVLSYLFVRGQPPTCLRSADVNDSGAIDIADPVYLLKHLFVRGPAPARPFQACGPDETPDTLSCKTFRLCP